MKSESKNIHQGIKSSNSLISVIVPVYNVKPYLEKCVASIVNQTYKNLEIILVDDGSTDGSGLLCDQFAQKDKRIKVIHKKNGGLSDARNAGMEVSTGDFIAFVDSDDWLDIDMYEILLSNIRKTNSDVAKCRCRRVFEKHIVDEGEDKIDVLSDKTQVIKKIFLDGSFGFSVWNALFKREVFSNIIFPVRFTSEDIYIVLNWIEASKKVCFDGRSKYNYTVRVGSITEPIKYSKSIKDVIIACDRNYYAIVERFPDLKDVAEYRVWWGRKACLDRIFKCSDWRENCLGDVKEIQKLMYSDVVRFMKNKWVTKNQLVAYLLISISPITYKMMYLLRSKVMEHQ